MRELCQVLSIPCATRESTGACRCATRESTGSKRIALRSPCSAQALGDHCAALSLLRASPGCPSMATRATHALRPWSPVRRMRRTRPLRVMLTGKIMLCLHFDEAAGGALKLEAEPFAAIEFRGRRGGRYHDLDAAIVEFVDGGDEAARGVLVGLGESGDVRYENRVVGAREFDVVVLAARTFAELAEFEPRHVRPRGYRGEVAVFDRQHFGARDGVAGERRKTPLKLRRRAGKRRIEVGRCLFQLPQTIVDSGVQVHHVHMVA